MKRLILGDCIEQMALLEGNSVDAVVTDPPYGLGFMGKEWDTFDKSQFGLAGKEGVNDLKVKKGFNALPRYGKSGGTEFTDFSRSWAEQAFRVLGAGCFLLSFGGTRTYHQMVTGVEAAGFEIKDTLSWIYGTGFPKGGWLKPAQELIVLARKPGKKPRRLDVTSTRIGDERFSINGKGNDNMFHGGFANEVENPERVGRYPANIAFDEDAAGLFEESRFFYCAKASKSEREAGLEALPQAAVARGEDYSEGQGIGLNKIKIRKNNHPTVKPLALMEWLIKLVSQEGDTVLDPFMGSGSTGLACLTENRNFVGIERDAVYFAIASSRIKNEEE